MLRACVCVLICLIVEIIKSVEEKLIQSVCVASVVAREAPRSEFICSYKYIHLCNIRDISESAADI